MRRLLLSRILSVLPAGSSTSDRQLARLQAGLIAFYALAMAALVAATMGLDRAERRDYVGQAERSSLSLARSLKEHATRSFASVGQAMQNLVEDFERGGGIVMMDEHWAYERLKAKVELTPQIRAIIAIDEEGILAAHGLEYPTRRIDLSDRDYFAWHRSHNDLRLRIGDPIVSRTDYKWLIPITRRINHLDGSFGGVMLAGVEPDYFLRFYESLHLEAGTRIELLRNDGIELLNFPLDISRLGTAVERDRNAGPLPANPEGIVVHDTDAAGTFLTQISSPDLGWMIRVSVDADHALQGYYQSRFKRILAAALGGSVLSALFLLLLYQIRRIRNSESRLALTQRTVDEAADMIFWCAPSGELHYTNRRLCDVCEVPQGALLGKHFDELISVPEHAWESLCAQLHEKPRLHLEGELKKRKDVRIAIEFSLSRIESGRQSFLCITGRDISERQQTARELIDHRDHLQALVAERTAQIRAMLDANPQAIILSVDEHIKMVNPAFEALFGFSPASITGLPESSIHRDPYAYACTRSAIQSRLNLGGTFRGEAELRRCDGTLFWAQICVRALHPETLDKGVIFIIDDVTAQRDATEQVRRSERLKRAVLDSAAEGFALVDEEHRFTEVNQAFCSQLGVERQALLGQTAESLWGQQLAEQVFPVRTPVGYKAQTVELEMPSGGGRKTPFLVSRGSTLNENGLGRHYFAFFTNIQQSKDNERVLRAARDAAESASQTRSQFLANMSHELRTPMHAILSFAELGTRKGLGSSNAELARYFERITQAGTRLNALLDDLFSLSRQSSPAAEERAPGLLHDNLLAALGELASLEPELAEQVRIEAADAPVSAVLDRARLSQALLGMLATALNLHAADSAVSGRSLAQADPASGAPLACIALEFEVQPGSAQHCASTLGNASLDTPALAECRRTAREHGGTLLASALDDTHVQLLLALPASSESPAEMPSV